MHKDAPDEFGQFEARSNMMTTLEELGFQSLHVYDEVCCSGVSCKNFVIVRHYSILCSNPFRLTLNLIRLGGKSYQAHIQWSIFSQMNQYFFPDMLKPYGNTTQLPCSIER